MYLSPNCHIYTKSKDRIINIDNRNGGVQEYSISNQKWSKWSLKYTPPSLPRPSLVLKTSDEKYLLIIGGGTRIITVYNVKQNIFYQSNIQCPAISEIFNSDFIYQGIIMGNKQNDELLTFGFIRNLFDNHDFNGIQPLPHYMIKLISNWINNDKVHIFDKEHHFQINLDKILQSNRMTN